VAFSQRLPAGIHNIHTEPGWAEFAQVLVSLSAAVTAQVTGRLADQLQAALAHRWLIEQAKGVIMGREELDAQAAFERLRRAARNSTRRLADVAKDVTGGQPLPASGRARARARAEQAKNRETAT
jgi:hypothetical protein